MVVDVALIGAGVMSATLGTLLREAHPTVDHYLPALTIAGAADAKDALTFMTDAIDLGSVSMRSFIFHSA